MLYIFKLNYYKVMLLELLKKLLISIFSDFSLLYL
ncbi:hypothetical protein QE390_004806 [Siphonobacter sp. SORGH_AS 1065]|nr:hypothetical protein [Siphonobacter sp. SORGH_AS_1065]